MNDTESLDTAHEPTSQSPSESLGDLILARLLPMSSSVSTKKLRDELAPFYRETLTEDRVEEALVRLRSHGLVAETGQVATQPGRDRAMDYLGLKMLPPKTTWSSIKSKYLLPKALGVRPNSAEADKLNKLDRLAALLLKRNLHLPEAAGNTLKQVMEAIACRQLGYPEHTKLQSLLPILLGQVIGGDPLRAKDMETVVARVLLNSPRGGIAGLREVALRDLVTPPSVAGCSEADESFDLPGFVTAVRAAAKASPTGRFGENKVFINHVWNQLRVEPRYARLELPRFKDKLLMANRSGLLTLSRADLVQLMDPADVRESETRHLNAVFHFVLIDKE